VIVPPLRDQGHWSSSSVTHPWLIKARGVPCNSDPEIGGGVLQNNQTATEMTTEMAYPAIGRPFPPYHGRPAPDLPEWSGHGGTPSSLMELASDLEAVRRELETLVFARGLGELRPVDKERYAELCEMERALLARRAG